MNEEQNDFLEKLLVLEREATQIAGAMVVQLLKARFDIMGPVILPARNRAE